MVLKCCNRSPVLVKSGLQCVLMRFPKKANTKLTEFRIVTSLSVPQHARYARSSSQVQARSLR